MNMKGVISSINTVNKIARVIFPELDEILTYEIEIAEHVSNLNINDTVLVSFWNNNMRDGIITCKMR